MDYNQWLRYFRLTVAVDDTNTEALDLSDFRVRFAITQRLASRPTTAEITVYNVSQTTVDAIQVPTNELVKNSRLHVILEAGYEEDHAIIFQGDLWWKSTGRESETDTYMKLIAAAGDRAHQYAVVNLSLPKGATQDQVFSAVAASMQEKGVAPPVNRPTLMATKLPRGKVLYSMAAEAMQGIADTNNFEWCYGTNGLIAVPKEHIYDPDEDVIVLDSTTGLIGRPTVTVDGVEIQCLLNPRLDVGSLVQIDQKLVQTQTWSTESSEGAVQANMASSDAMIAADGIYRVFSREFVGDTRGTEWYANLMAYGVNAQRPITPAVNQTFPNM